MIGIIDSPKPEPAHEQRAGQQDLAGGRGDEGEGDGGGAMITMPNGTTRVARPGRRFVPDFAHEQGSADSLWGHEESGLPRALPAGDLVVERQEEHGAVEGGAHHEHADVGDGEVAVLEQAQIEQRIADAQGMSTTKRS